MQTRKTSNIQPPYSTSPVLDAFDCIQHGFYGAEGGVSQGRYASLNCGYASHDTPEAVADNRRRVAAQFGVSEHRLFSLKQAHTIEVVHITPKTSPQFKTEADAMVSTDAGLALGVLGADCAPVLFVDPVNKVIGAAHSGWKGALLGINETVIAKMCSLGAQRENIHAAIGPAMQRKKYAVRADFQRMFEQTSRLDSAPFFHHNDGKMVFDTPAYIAARLHDSGIKHVGLSQQDTFTQPGKYFSYRYACQQGVRDYGRQISVIALKL